MLGVVALLAFVRGFRVTDVWLVTLGQNPAADAWSEHGAMLATSDRALLESEHIEPTAVRDLILRHVFD